ncbi:hypothetical protein BGZ95_010508 [Linnemannia exigua]|uniref:Low temperature viability protein n=1 Tax=Linnemannia exigua TaxID=604196 RepID=A0AAD4DD88_9FUNG|nr:hypothetical protein BGZ95_010508 [Linnemannia exigua]
MGKKQFIDRKNARHFHLVHRSQRDPLSRDESAPQRVLKEVIPANLIGKVAIPQEEFDGDAYSDGDDDIFGEHGTEDGINYGTYDREVEAVELLEAPVAGSKKKKGTAKNEDKIGEAAMLGLVSDEFNDGSYDYSQHFKEIGTSSEGVFMAAPKVAAQQKKAAQQSRGIQFTDADAADEMAREDVGTAAGKKKGKIQLPAGVLPSREELDFADVYQSAVPMGLQPDMPFDIRQTLEALEDEEFVDGELDESFFDQLDEDGDFEDEEVEEYYEDEDEEEEGGRQGWEADFKKFKKAQQYQSDDDSFEGSDDGHSQTSRSSRRPAGASASTFSMSSSAMFRNENLTLLDERFDKVEREYESDSDDDEDEGTDFKGEELRKDFDSILDDFLDKFEIVGSKMVPRLEGATSENKLSTIRNALLVDEGEEERSLATTVGGTRRPKKNLDDDMATELQTDFRSRAERMRDNWDVQTILSTYSNLDNHPGMIKEQRRRRIHIDPKTGMPVVTEKLSKKALQRQAEVAAAAEAAARAENGDGNSDDEFDDEEEDFEEAENLGAKRNKTETKEEKKARKEAIKQEKKSRRETKKATKTAFANEKNRQEKVMKNLKKGQGVTHLD